MQCAGLAPGPSRPPAEVIEADHKLDAAYSSFVREAVDAARQSADVDGALTVMLLARSLERIGDHCTNIAEDVFFLNTGDIIRHSAAFKAKAPDNE